MSDTVRFRLAKTKDIGAIANLHFQASKDQPGGFLFKLGPFFIKAYYSIAINEPHNILLCAESTSGEILGFISGSTVAEEHLLALRRHWIKLGLSAIIPVLIRPFLLSSIWKRFRFINGDNGATQFCAGHGARIEFWGWKKDDPFSFMSINMLESMLKIMQIFGAKQVFGEVDETNTRLVKMHKLMGCEKVFDLGEVDGRYRAIYVHDLEKSVGWRK